MSGQAGEPDISDRVVRGFAAMVESEQAAANLAPPAVPAPAPGGAVGSGGHGAVDASDVAASRLAAIEEQVRQTMEALSELVQAEIPEAVDGLRDELGSLRVDVQASLDQATGDFAHERQELRAQIAKTVGAANRWFVKARDQLIERLDELAKVAAETGAKAREAAEAASVASAAATTTAAATSAAATPAATTDATTATTAAARPDRSPAPVVEVVKDGVVEWDVEGDDGEPGAKASPARPAAAGRTPGAGIDPVRGDIRELQGEISAMGQAIAELRAEVLALGKRLPARAKPVRLDERDIDLIVESVVISLTPPRPPKKSPAKRTVR